MIGKIAQKLRQLTMKSKIILFNVLTLVIVLSVVWINYYVQTEIFSSISLSSLYHILQEQDKDQIGFIAQNVAVIIELKFMSILSQMEQMKKFYFFFEKEKSTIVNNQKMDPCVSIEDFMKNNFSLYTPKFCYQAIGVPDYVTLPQNETGVLILHDFISLLNHYSLALDVSYSGMIEISSVSKTKYFSQFPFCFLLPWFDITSLSWYYNTYFRYQNHLQITQKNQQEGFIFSPLSDFFITKIKEMSITSSLYHDGQLIGIIREGLIISEYLIPQVPYNVLLLDQEGLVVYFNIEQLRNKTDYFYIYDQNITGFNTTDWEEMIQFSNQREKVILVLENKLQQEKVNVYSLEVLKNNFTLIVYYYYLCKLYQYHYKNRLVEQIFSNKRNLIFQFYNLFICINIFRNYSYNTLNLCIINSIQAFKIIQFNYQKIYIITGKQCQQ